MERNLQNFRVELDNNFNDNKNYIIFLRGYSLVCCSSFKVSSEQEEQSFMLSDDKE